MKRSAARTTGMLAVSILIAVFAVAPVAFAADGDVNLCHATNSDKNPYEQKTVPQSAIFNDGRIVDSGHGTHIGGVFGASGSAQWGDIIPAFGLYGGLNVAAGQAWVDRGCEPPPKLKLVKTVVGGNAKDTDWTLSAGLTSTRTLFEGPTGTTREVLAGTYFLKETYKLTQPSGYTGSLWRCTNATAPGLTVTILPADVEDVTCTITNTVNSTLTVKKTNLAGGTLGGATFALHSGSESGVQVGSCTTTASTGTCSVMGLATGSYYWVETVAPAGYILPTGSDAVSGPVAVTAINAGTTIAPTVVTDIAETVVVAPETHLTLVKTVSNNFGGTATAKDWTLTATGTTTGISGQTGETAVTNVVVTPGDYRLSESGDGPSGYFGTWSCSGVTLGDGDVVSLGEGESAICTLNNADRPASLSLAKTVTNAFGGTSVPTDWTLTATQQEPAAGTTAATVAGQGSASGLVPAGQYLLTESGEASDYSSTGWSCDGASVVDSVVTVALGSSVDCTINNSDAPASLSLSKTVEATFGGTSVPTDWTLTATQQGDLTNPVTISGEGAVSGSVSAGQYLLTESGRPAGYMANGWMCQGGSLDGAVLTLLHGQSAVCSITNTDKPAHLTLVKKVLNEHGGTQPDTAWTLSADGPTLMSGKTGVTSAVSAGTYSLAESGPAGYDASPWECDGGTLHTASLTLALGQSATCTITNTDRVTETGTDTSIGNPTVPSRITLKAAVVNDAGGTAQVSDFTLTGSSIEVTHKGAVQHSAAMVASAVATSFSGATGAAAITNAAIPVGTYFLSESALPSGYSASAWACTGGQLNGSAITVALGNTVECVITNTYSSTVVDSPGVPTAHPASPPAAVVAVDKAAPGAKAPTAATPAAATPAAATPTAATPTVTTLAFTGADPVPLSLLALLALVLGVALTVAGRRQGGHWARE